MDNTRTEMTGCSASLLLFLLALICSRKPGLAIVSALASQVILGEGDDMP